MKTTTKLLAAISASIIISSCGNSGTDADACKCVQQAANDYMIKGVRLQSIDNLKQPCKELIDKFEQDAKGRATINDCGLDVLKKMTSKEVFAIDGKVPEFPTYKFKTLSEFIGSLKKDDPDVEYKYLKTHIEIENTVLFDYSTKGGVIVKEEKSDANVLLLTEGATVDTNLFKKAVYIGSGGEYTTNEDIAKYGMLCDTKTQELILKGYKDGYGVALDWNRLSEGLKNDLESIYEFDNEKWGIHLYKTLQDISKYLGIDAETFVSNAKNGNYKVISMSDFRTLVPNGDTYFSTKGNFKADYIGYSSASANGFTMTACKLNNPTFTNVAKNTPEIFKSGGTKIDFSPILKYKQ